MSKETELAWKKQQGDPPLDALTHFGVEENENADNELGSWELLIPLVGSELLTPRGCSVSNKN